jgi:hypothetical protein
MDTMQSPFSSLAVFLKDLNALKYTEYSFWRHIVWNTDYGHTMAKSLIQIPILNRYLGFGYKGLAFCRNNGWLMKNINKGQYQNECW